MFKVICGTLALGVLLILGVSSCSSKSVTMDDFYDVNKRLLDESFACGDAVEDSQDAVKVSEISLTRFREARAILEENEDQSNQDADGNLTSVTQDQIRRAIAVLEQALEEIESFCPPGATP